MNLDLKDLKILSELDKNSRQSSNQIARKVRLNKNTVNFRINKLLTNKVILGFYPSIDLSRLGYLAIRVYFKFFNANPKTEENIINELLKNNSVGILAELDASYDIMFMHISKDIYEFENFWNKFKQKHRKNIFGEKINLMTKVIHFKRNWIAGEKSIKEEIIGRNKEVKFDKKDLKILSILSKNCRTNTLDISKKLKLPETTIAFRIRQLEKKEIIQGYRINLNLGYFNREYYKVNLKLDDLSKKEELIAFCKENPQVIFIDFSISDYDFEFDVEVENKENISNILKTIKNRFAKIQDYEVISFKKYHKVESVPEALSIN